MAPITLDPIGTVVCDERDAARLDWSRVRSEVRLAGDLGPDREALLLGLGDYSHVIVVGWLHELPEELRQRRQAYPSGDERYPLQGALALRGARPNPISVTVCKLRGVEGSVLRLEGLDLIDGTPVLDVKPYIAHYDAEPKASSPRWARG